MQMMRENKDNYKFLVWSISFIISIAGILVALVTSCEVAIYGDMGYYQTLYEKYGVAEDLQMEIEDIVYVTEEMMLYLRGDRENLIVETVVNGVEQDIESEISHMEDVQELFVGGLMVRNISIGIIIVLLLLLILLKTNWRNVLPQAFRYTTCVFVLIVGWLGYLFATDFYTYFEKFHNIFFEDGTWTFNPDESLMINMLPEGLFYDFTLRIVVVFIVIMVFLFVLTYIMKRKIK